MGWETIRAAILPIMGKVPQRGGVKLFFFIDFYADGCGKKRDRIKLTKVRRINETRNIFFGGDDDFLRSLELSVPLNDAIDIVVCVGMMVGKSQCRHMFEAAFQRIDQWLRAGNAAEQQDGVGQVGIRLVGSGTDRFEGLVDER